MDDRLNLKYTVIRNKKNKSCLPLDLKDLLLRDVEPAKFPDISLLDLGKCLKSPIWFYRIMGLCLCTLLEDLP